jgi:hypothetical protein
MPTPPKPGEPGSTLPDPAVQSPGTIPPDVAHTPNPGRDPRDPDPRDPDQRNPRGTQPPREPNVPPENQPKRGR